MSDYSILPIDEAGASDQALEALLRSTYVDEGFTNPATAADQFRAAAVKARGLVLVAQARDGALAGTATMVLSDSPRARFAQAGEAELQLLCVRSSCRRRGLGRSLVEAAVGAARNAGAQRMILWTQASMVAAQRLYEQSGFERVPALDFARGPRAYLVFARSI